jgi:hypothetical protein
MGCGNSSGLTRWLDAELSRVPLRQRKVEAVAALRGEGGVVRVGGGSAHRETEVGVEGRRLRPMRVRIRWGKGCFSVEWARI